MRYVVSPFPPPLAWLFPVAVIAWQAYKPGYPCFSPRTGWGEVNPGSDIYFPTPLH